MRIFGIVLLGTSYLVILGDAVFFGRFIHTAVIIFVVLALLALVARRWRLRELVLVFFGGVITVVVAAYVFHPVSEKVRIILGDTRTLYRIESYPSSWHIASQHPLFGIGLGSRVSNYLEDYHSLYAQWPTPKLFKQMVAEINNPDSAYPALMIFLGIPFTVIYLFALLVLLGMLFRALWRPPPSMVFHPLALAVPILASMMHFVDLEGLLYDDISWFFHILLGMIPISTSAENRGGK